MHKTKDTAIPSGVCVCYGADGRNRTDDLLITSELLYP
jgi:hypothetical protein